MEYLTLEELDQKYPNKDFMEKMYLEHISIGDIYEEWVLRNKARPLTIKDIRKRNNKPIYVVSTDQWLNVHEDCNKKSVWIVVKIVNGHFDNNGVLPLLFNESTYNKYRRAYDIEIEV